MNRYTNAYSPFRRPGSLVSSNYALAPSYSVGRSPEAKAPYKPYSAPNAGTQARWTGERNSFMQFPTLSAIGSQVGKGIDKKVANDRAEREKAEREQQRENRRTSISRGNVPGRSTKRGSGSSSTPTASTPSFDEDLTGGLDPNADPGAPSTPPGAFQPSLFDDPGFALPPSPPSGAVASQPNSAFTTRGNNVNTPWAMKQQRTGNDQAFAPLYPGSANRGPAPTTRTGQPLLGPRNRRRR